jgi:hypothetical protein
MLPRIGVSVEAISFRMVPPILPRPDLLVTITGLLEITGAIALLFSPTAMLAALCLAGVLIAMFPANIFCRETPPDHWRTGSHSSFGTCLSEHQMGWYRRPGSNNSPAGLCSCQLYCPVLNFIRQVRTLFSEYKQLYSENKVGPFK